jgi:hypothetical protein
MNTMKNVRYNNKYGWVLAGVAAGAILAAAGDARGCACGCGVFDVATSDMFPKASGGMAYFEYDFSDQNRNWDGTSKAPAANNGDKRIETQFTSYGLQYMFNPNWGARAELPYDFRSFTTSSGAPGNPLAKLNWGSLGDARIEGIYTGLSQDLSGGITFGLKLPTGDFHHNDRYGDVDRDSELGSGSVDALLGGFYHHKFSGDGNWTWFAQGVADLPVLTQNQYRPGVEIDTAAGIYRSGWMLGHLMITPVAQVIASERTSDSGANASGGANDDPGMIASGYQRLMLSPGIELHLHPYPVSLYADVEVPMFQDFRGNQLAAPELFKVILSYHF